MADPKEAAQSQGSSESEMSDFIEPEVPDDKEYQTLFASDSYENLYYEDIDANNFRGESAGTIHAIVRQGSVCVENDSNFEEQVSQKTPDEPEDLQSNFSMPELVEALESQSEKETVQEIDPLSIGEDEDLSDEDNVCSLKWRSRKKHVFVLTDAGKPVYSRYGNEDKLVTIMGVMQALISFVQDEKDLLRSVVAGDHKFIFLVREHLVLVGVSSGSDSTQQILLQLTYLYNQVLSVLTKSTLTRIFKERRNYDLRRLLCGAEKLMDNLLNMIDTEPGFLLGGVRCLPLDCAVRDIISQSILHYVKVKDLVFALIIAHNQLVTLVRMKKYYLHPMDLHLIINLVNASESFKAAESWAPICLPKFDSSGFLQGHISYLDESCQTCLLLLTVDRDSFFVLSECKNKIMERLMKYNVLKAIGDSLTKKKYSIQNCGISDLRHFLYKSRSLAQYTSPELEAPYITQSEQERLFDVYKYLHHRIHTSARPLKILYHVGKHETLLGWVTQGFELYAVFGPLVTKPAAIHAINKLLRWIKREEDRLFILNSVTF